MDGAGGALQGPGQVGTHRHRRGCGMCRPAHARGCNSCCCCCFLACAVVLLDLSLPVDTRVVWPVWKLVCWRRRRYPSPRMAGGQRLHPVAALVGHSVGLGSPWGTRPSESHDLVVCTATATEPTHVGGQGPSNVGMAPGLRQCCRPAPPSACVPRLLFHYLPLCCWICRCLACHNIIRLVGLACLEAGRLATPRGIWPLAWQWEAFDTCSGPWGPTWAWAGRP